VVWLRLRMRVGGGRLVSLVLRRAASAGGDSLMNAHHVICSLP
jgi:hypothetical protein